MAILEFRHGYLTDELDAISPHDRIAFAASCAQRMLPLYSRFVAESGKVNPLGLEAILNELWRDLRSEEKL